MGVEELAADPSDSTQVEIANAIDGELEPVTLIVDGQTGPLEFTGLYDPDPETQSTDPRCD